MIVVSNKCKDCTYCIYHSDKNKNKVGIGFCLNHLSENYFERVFEDDVACDDFDRHFKEEVDE